MVARAVEEGAWGTLPVRVDIGNEDPFLDATVAFTERLGRAGGSVQLIRGPGGHDGGYWRANAASWLDAYEGAIEDCTDT